MDDKITLAVREKAKELLEQKVVDCFIGYEKATDNLTSRPLFVYKPEQAERLVFDNTCVHNLSKYLLNKKDTKTAVVAKPCDARAIVVLLNENQVQREKIYIIGIVCPGVVDSRWGSAGTEPEVRCQGCPQHTPPLYDFLIGEPTDEVEQDAYTDVTAMEEMGDADREAFWKEQFQRCIRCYACRNVCPGCYCPVCFVDLKEPLWAGIRVAPGENWMWNNIRAFHLLGRCIDCNGCQRVCPVNIPLMLLNRKLKKEVAQAFAFIPGMDPKALAPLATFKKEELAEPSK
ncbi:MAG: 4Fe-4S dicluster domain-containing protein [Dehalococcoidia bacterium]|nr:4Fe-4S dicluster domain-containing protein [Dehalococcoidia bacterium]